jgi:hypothetical protein
MFTTSASRSPSPSPPYTRTGRPPRAVRAPPTSPRPRSPRRTPGARVDGGEGDLSFDEYRATVRDGVPGDRVEVWFTGESGDGPKVSRAHGPGHAVSSGFTPWSGGGASMRAAMPRSPSRRVSPWRHHPGRRPTAAVPGGIDCTPHPHALDAYKRLTRTSDLTGVSAAGETSPGARHVAGPSVGSPAAWKERTRTGRCSGRTRRCSGREGCHVDRSRPPCSNR